MHIKELPTYIERERGRERERERGRKRDRERGKERERESDHKSEKLLSSRHLKRRRRCLALASVGDDHSCLARASERKLKV